MTEPNALAARRAELGLTQTQLAERAGVSRHTVLRAERGELPNPRLTTTRAIADVLGMELLDFVKDADPLWKQATAAVEPIHGILVDRLDAYLSAQGALLPDELAELIEEALATAYVEGAHTTATHVQTSLVHVLKAPSANGFTAEAA